MFSINFLLFYYNNSFFKNIQAVNLKYFLIFLIVIVDLSIIILINISSESGKCNIHYNYDMNINQRVKILLASEAVTLTKVADRLAKEKNKKITMNNLSRKLRSETIKFAEIEMIADLLGYDIEFVKRK